MKGLGKTIRRRRQEGKTDYVARLALLKSEDPRIVARRSNRYMHVSLVSSEGAQDKVICLADSKELLAQGWPVKNAGSLKSLGACYLTGRMLAKRAQKHGIKKAILDIGIQRNAAGGRLYAVLKGLIDGGLHVPHSTEALPTNERLKHNPSTRPLIEKMSDGVH
jgi:large subunit ribosomal protein L18